MVVHFIDLINSVFFIIGSFGSWKALGKLLDNPVYGVQSSPTTPMASIRAMAGFYTQVEIQFPLSSQTKKIFTHAILKYLYLLLKELFK